MIRLLIVGLIPVFCILCLYTLVGLNTFNNIPTNNSLKNISNPIASELFSSDDKLIGRYYIENRIHLKEEELNDIYKNALIAIEDHRYYDHNGVDYKSLFRVIFKTILLQKDASGGGSTITQQLAKNLYPRKKHIFISTIINKFREMHIAKKLEKIYSKSEILWLYSSTVSFGENAFGLASASKRFFNKKPSELLIEEAATLVGILKATTYYSPRKYPDRAKARRDLVLFQMHKHGYISEQAYNDLKKSSLNLNYQSKDNAYGFAPYFHQHVRKEFSKLSNTLRKPDGSKYNIYHDGLKIYSSLDYDMQVAAQKIVRDHMTQLQDIFEQSWSGGRMYGRNNKIIDDKIIKHPAYKKLREKGQSGKEALKNFNIESEQSFWTWKGIETKKATRIDSIKHALKLLHTGLLASNPKTGEIKVWLGGNDYSEFQYDNITEGRQVGSLFKPIVYLTALEQEKTPCDFYKNELKTYEDYDDWTPKNASDEYGGYLSMKAALAHSVNTVSVQVLFDAGIDDVVNTAKSLGVTSRLAKVPSIVLGTSDVSLYEMVQAYAKISNSESGNGLHSIKRIEDIDGNIIYENKNDSIAEPLPFDNNNVKELKEMMTAVTREGTASRLYSLFDIPFPVFGKTGTTQRQSDGWFIGCTDELVIGSWVGTKDRRMHFRNIGTGSGGRTALPMVGALLEYAGIKGLINYTYKPSEKFDCPDFLNDEEYAYYQENKKTPEVIDEVVSESEYGGWLGKILRGNKKKKRKGTLNEQYEERKIKKALDKLKKERNARMAEYEIEMKEWEKKLQALRESQ
ncbi:MAG: penicillin-binding protein [Saprospiraceae bacterium]|nr:penicillin-binding protein [Saprospiraceae bacterium]